MTSDGVTLDILEYLFKGAVALIFAVGGWLWKGLVDDVKALTKNHTDHVLEVEKTYSKKDDVKLAFTTLNDSISEIRDDVKDLIRTVAGNGNHKN